MTRPNAAVALESAAKARAAMQTAQQRGAAAGGQPSPAPQAQAPQRPPQAAPRRLQPQAQPARAAPVAYPNPEWNPKAQAAKALQGLPVQPQAQAVALPAGMAPGAKPGGNIYASMAPGDKKQALANLAAKQQSALSEGGRGEAVAPLQSQAWALPYGDDGEEFDPLSGDGFMAPGEEVSDPLNDPSMWSDVTEDFEEDYGTPEEQQAKQNEALAFQEQYGVTPEEMAGIIGMGDVDYGALLEGAEGSDDLGLAGLDPEGWDDTAALAGMDEDDWANESNPGPGWSWNDATGKWTQEALPPGVSADDPRWNYNQEAGKWQLFDASGEENLVDRDYWDEKAKGALESDVEDYMNPELENQKKQAWDQAQAANLDVAKALGSRGIGASGLVGMGMGDIFKATQNNVQSLEFDEYTAAAERRLKEIQVILSGRQGDLSAEMQKELADEAAKLEKELAAMQYAREDRDDIWQQIDNMAAAMEKKAGEGWNVASQNEFRDWASTPGNDPYKAVVYVSPNGEIVFDRKASDAKNNTAKQPVKPPEEFGVNETWFGSDLSDAQSWRKAWKQYQSQAATAGFNAMSFDEFVDWASEAFFNGQKPAGDSGGGGGDKATEWAEQFVSSDSDGYDGEKNKDDPFWNDEPPDENYDEDLI